jgi:hypothetical protein
MYMYVLLKKTGGQQPFTANILLKKKFPVLEFLNNPWELRTE